MQNPIKGASMGGSNVGGMDYSHVIGLGNTMGAPLGSSGQGYDQGNYYSQGKRSNNSNMVGLGGTRSGMGTIKGFMDGLGSSGAPYSMKMGGGTYNNQMYRKPNEGKLLPTLNNKKMMVASE